MTDRGDYIAVEAGDAARELPALLKAVEGEGRRVRIFRNGAAVAELTPALQQAAFPVFPELTGVQFIGDPLAPIDESEWPESCR